MRNSTTDILIRIKNSYLAKIKSLEVVHSKFVENLIKILVVNGYLKEYEIVGEKAKKQIKIYLKYEKKQPAITGVKIISKPSLKVYFKFDKVKKVFGGSGINIISTSKGLMTGKEARKAKLGGELICQVW